jgi:hypothetical protein
MKHLVQVLDILQRVVALAVDTPMSHLVQVLDTMQVGIVLVVVILIKHPVQVQVNLPKDIVQTIHTQTKLHVWVRVPGVLVVVPEDLPSLMNLLVQVLDTQVLRTALIGNIVILIHVLTAELRGIKILGRVTNILGHLVRSQVTDILGHLAHSRVMDTLGHLQTGEIMDTLGQVVLG